MSFRTWKRLSMLFQGPAVPLQHHLLHALVLQQHKYRLSTKVGCPHNKRRRHRARSSSTKASGSSMEEILMSIVAAAGGVTGCSSIWNTCCSACSWVIASNHCCYSWCRSRWAWCRVQWRLTRNLAKSLSREVPMKASGTSSHVLAPLKNPGMCMSDSGDRQLWQSFMFAFIFHCAFHCTFKNST